MVHLPDYKVVGPDYKKVMGRVQDLPMPAMPKQLRRAVPLCLAILVSFVLLSYSYTSFAAPASEPSHFPRKIWQLWKTHPLTFEGRDLDLARSWATTNPDFRYEVLTDSTDVAYVERNFGPEGLARPDIVDAYKALKDHIVKADLLRYLIMYVEGGVYADIDVEALRPISRFVPERINEMDVDMVVGIEIDEPTYFQHPILGGKCMSFCQWTFMCKPRQPVMLKLVENILVWLEKVRKEEKVELADIKLDFDQIISGTGPSAFTKAILEDVSRRVGHEVTWDQFHGITEAKNVGGFLVLPVEAFAAGQGHSDSGTHENKYALVRHHYHASHWPDAHPRFHHPFVGEVEDCNWKKDCVEKWDKDKAWFDNLTKEDQERELGIKKGQEDEKLREKERKKEADRLKEEEKIAQEERDKAAERVKEAKALIAAIEEENAAKVKGANIDKVAIAVPGTETEMKGKDKATTKALTEPETHV